MIGPVIATAYDFQGTRTLIPIRRATPIFRPTFPMGRFIACSLAVKCREISEIREFLSTCRYLSDLDQFGMDDYWLPPDKFEETRAGDCEDYALWTWRQLMDLGYRSRLVVGFSGRYGAGHAWVNSVINGENCLVEPQRHWVKKPMPRLSTVRYRPEVSVEWDGKRLHYFRHEDFKFEPRFRELIPLVLEWLSVWVPLWPRIGLALTKRFGRIVG